MTIAEMLGQSGKMALIGMGIVFGFLFILIVAVSLMGKIMIALGAAGDEASQSSAPSAVAQAASQTAVVAAIGAAVTQYRKDNP